jgi:hypothetical protein
MIIGFLHTSDVHVSTFTTLLNEISPGDSSIHVVDDVLLADAGQRGGVDDELQARIASRLREASNGATVVVCTCSTISGAAENLSDAIGIPIIRVDRPMAERAVKYGSHIAVVACLQSTLAPTVALLTEVAAQRKLSPRIDEVICPDAWRPFENGDFEDYARIIARTIDSLDPVPDVIVLAQASMASAADLCRTTSPVLSSPRSAVEFAVAFA